MRIALVLMPWYRRESPCPELALTSALLRERNHKVHVYDLNNDIFCRQYKNRGYWRFFLLDAPREVRDDFFEKTRDAFEDFASRILSQEMDVIIFKIAGRTHHCSSQMAKIIRERDPKKILIASGFLFPSKEHEDEFMNGPENSFDFVIFGEDEIALPKLLNALENNTAHLLGTRIEKNSRFVNYIKDTIVEDLDTLPFYDFSDFDLTSYRFPDKLEMFISKGCIWRCSFCVDWLIEKRYRSMSGERIYREMLYQSKIYKNSHFRFCDKTINGDIKALNVLCNLLVEGYKRGLKKMYWSGDAMIRPEMTRDFLMKMYKAGCKGLGYGIESGSQDVIDAMGKRFSVALAEEVLRNTRDAGIHIDINILVGFPTENQADFEKTMNFVRRNKENIDELRLTYAGCRVYPGSILATSPERYNLADTNTDYWSTRDRLNTYEERVKRSEAVCQLALSLGLETRINSRITRKAKIRQ